jgi:two-component system sensor histidine kinase DevS
VVGWRSTGTASRCHFRVTVVPSNGERAITSGPGGQDRTRPSVPTLASRLALDELLDELTSQADELADAHGRLWQLIDVIAQVASADLTIDSVLQRVVEVARDAVGATYAALGVIGDHGTLQAFVHTGMDDATVQAIGHLPEGHGLLGLLITEPQVLRLDDLSAHAAAVGFPPHHPVMTTFLGVPISIRGHVYGNLYLADRHGGGGFTDDDVGVVTTLAAAAAVAIDHARLHDLAQRRQQWLEAIRDLTADLLRGSDGQRVRHSLAARVLALTDAAVAALVMTGLDGEPVVAAADGANAADLVGRPLDGAASVLALTADAGQATAVDASELDDGVGPLAAVGDIGPLMVVPLRVRDEEVGALIVARGKDAAPFDGDELGAATDFAGHAALALDYDDAQSRRRAAAVHADRERIGEDLHDLVIQRLFATGLTLESVVGRLDAPTTPDRIRDAVQEIDAAITDLRSAIFGLQLRRRGTTTFSHRLADLCRQARATLAFEPDCEIDGDLDDIISDELVPDVLATVRELLSNIARHANATRATVTVHVAEHALHLRVVDDGTGMPPHHRRSGLANLAARAARQGGSMTIDSDRSGTCVHWYVPLS